MNTKKGKRKSPTPAAPAPEWVTETPAPCDYQLIMWASDGDCVEEVDCSREEYEALKLALARMRGYKLPDAERSTRGKKSVA
jgi:hypothetical protein